MSEKEWFTSKDACNYLQVSHMTIHRWMKSRKLTYFKMGGAVRFKKESLAHKSTGKKEVEQLSDRCTNCGNHELIEGHVQRTGKQYFKPKKTNFFAFAEFLIPIRSTMCSACGHIQTYANTKKFEKLRPN